MTRKELIALKEFLLSNHASVGDWFDPRADYDNKPAHAWRAVCYFIADVPTDGAESLERTNSALREFCRENGIE